MVDAAIAAPAPARAAPSPLRKALRSPATVFGVALVGFHLFLALFAPVIAPHSISAIFTDGLTPPSPEHWLGTDQIGRDYLSRLMSGGRVALLVSAIGVAAAVAVGTTLGLIAGYLGGWLDDVVMRVTDTLMSIPEIVLIAILVLTFGKDLAALSVIVALVYTPGVIRVVRARGHLARSARLCSRGRATRREPRLHPVPRDRAQPPRSSGGRVGHPHLRGGAQDIRAVVSRPRHQPADSRLGSDGAGGDERRLHRSLVPDSARRGALQPDHRGQFRRGRSGARLWRQHDGGLTMRDHGAAREAHVEATGVTVTYRDGAGGERAAVRAVELALGRGETLGIVGESGSGKSTLARCLLGYVRPGARLAAGRVRGRRRRPLRARARRPPRLSRRKRRHGASEPSLFPHAAHDRRRTAERAGAPTCAAAGARRPRARPRADGRDRLA
jgi:ABC-type multidrug transport system fused ATPase/permease subunit